MKSKKRTASIKAILRKERKDAKGQCPIVIRVTKNRKTATYSIGFRVLPKHWGDESVKGSHPDYQEINTAILGIKKTMNDKMNHFKSHQIDFNVEDLVSVPDNTDSGTTVLNYLEIQCSLMLERGKIQTLGTYKAAFSWVRKYLQGSDIPFSDFNYSFLLKLLDYIKKGNPEIAETTLFGYFKNFKALKNKAIKDEICNSTNNDLNKFSLSQFNTETQPRATSLHNISKLQRLSLPEFSMLWHARNMFLFSFFCQGINLIDIAFLTEQNIRDGVLYYKRSKTGDSFSILLHDKAIEIIDYYMGRSASSYLFPIFSDKEFTPIDFEKTISAYRKNINIRLKKIASLAGINEPITFYVARHTYATGLYANGVEIAEISQLLGHEAEDTTRKYLKKFSPSYLSHCNDKLFSKLDSNEYEFKIA